MTPFKSKWATKTYYALAQMAATDRRYRSRLHKYRSKGHVVKVERSLVERSDLTWCMMTAHLSKKSFCFSKSFQWLKAKFSVVVAVYNLFRPHGRLSSTAHNVTPAMAAKILQRNPGQWINCWDIRLIDNNNMTLPKIKRLTELTESDAASCDRCTLPLQNVKWMRGAKRIFNTGYAVKWLFERAGGFRPDRKPQTWGLPPHLR